MKQDSMDDKITKRCKTCEKQCMQEDLDGSRGVEQLLRSYREAIEQTETFSMDRETVKKLSRL